MSTTTTTATASALTSLPTAKAIADQALSTVAIAALNTFLPVIGNALDNIKANPSPENVVSQATAVEANIIAQFPDFDQEAISGLAANAKVLLTDVGNLLTQQAEVLGQQETTT